MFSRKLLLITLLSGMSLAGLLAQNNVHVHGTVTDSNGDPQDSVNILVSALYADSSGVFESLYTDVDGAYEVDFSGPPLNFLGIIEVSMVDCFGTLITQTFTVFNGSSDIEANFIYCEQIVIDSCLVYILEEWFPGTIPGLTAWTYANVQVDYLWSTDETTQTIYPNESGNYCVTVTFPWGCTGSDCYEYTIDSLGNCFAYITTTINSDGSYNLEAIVYGVSPFTYLWNTGETTSGLSNVGSGSYCVTTTDADSCVYTTCIIVDDFNFCEVYISEDPNGGLSAFGYGQEPLVYVWSTGDSSQTIFPVDPGFYCVTMTDQNGCSSSSCYQYGIFPDCYVFVNAFLIDSNTIALEAIAGSSSQDINYLWNTGDTTNIIYLLDPSVNYCVTITDGNGCVATGCYDSYNWCYAWVDVQYIDTNAAVLSVYTDPIFGWGGSNTATYLWSNGETGPIITVGETGEYCVTATLGTNCVTEACVYVDFESLQFDCSSWIIQYQDESTDQWFAEAFAWGYGTFTYLWSNGDTNAVIPIDSVNEFVCVTATSSFGCVTEACIDTTFNPCQVYISIGYMNNGAVLTASSWYGGANNNGTYIWNNGVSGPILTVTEEGTYCVTFTSADGCTSETCVDVFFGNNDPCGVWITTEQNPGGTLFTANVWGTPPFTYLWSNGGTEATQIIDFGLMDLCVTVTDSSGCVSSACTPEIDTLDPNNGINVISGFVFADSLVHVKGEVYAYGLEANTGLPFALVDSSQIGQQGFYSFKALEAGVYVIKAILTPGTVGAADYIPTYHLNSATWEEANPHVVPNWLPVTTDIWMRPVEGSNGSGVIGGVISDPQHIMTGDNEDQRGFAGLPNVEVLLKNEDGQPINFMFSNEDGGFRFTNLSFGTYRISYDIPGIHSPEVWVTLTAEDPERLQVTLIVNQTVSVDQPIQQELSLYPNPAKDEINIIMPLIHSTYGIQIVDIQGRIVFAGSGKSFDGILPIKVEQFSPGLYHINLKGENQFYYSRFLKLE